MDTGLAPSKVNVSPDAHSTPNRAQISPALASCTSLKTRTKTPTFVSGKTNFKDSLSCDHLFWTREKHVSNVSAVTRHRQYEGAGSSNIFMIKDK